MGKKSWEWDGMGIKTLFSGVPKIPFSEGIIFRLIIDRK